MKIQLIVYSGSEPCTYRSKAEFPPDEKEQSLAFINNVMMNGGGTFKFETDSDGILYFPEHFAGYFRVKVIGE